MNWNIKWHESVWLWHHPVIAAVGVAATILAVVVVWRLSR